MQDDKTPRLHAARTEPGRRFAAGARRPRAGADILPTSAPNSTPELIISTPAQPASVKERTITKVKPALPRTSRSLVLKREMAERAQQHRKKVRKKQRRNFTGVIIATIVFVSTGIVAWSFQALLPVSLSFLNPDSIKQLAAETPKQMEASTLNETPVSLEEIAGHKMATDEPRVVRIPGLKVEARIMRVGNSLTGEPISTSNIFDVGWYEASGKPGLPGAVLLNGHAIGPTKSGIFGNVSSLIPGDPIQIEKGDGSVVTYHVAKVQEYPMTQIDVSIATSPLEPTKQGLNLITTYNKYGAQNRMHQKRYIVFALK